MDYAKDAGAVIQPGDAYSQWMFGVNLVLSGEADKAVEHLSRALRLDPAEPRTPYLNVLGIARYAAKDYAEAIDAFDRNLARGGPTGPHMDVFRAGAYAELGYEGDAQTVIEGILLAHPGYPAEAWLSLWLGNNLGRTMDNLHRLGLPGRQ